MTNWKCVLRSGIWACTLSDLCHFLAWGFAFLVFISALFSFFLYFWIFYFSSKQKKTTNYMLRTELYWHSYLTYYKHGVFTFIIWYKNANAASWVMSRRRRNSGCLSEVSIEQIEDYPSISRLPQKVTTFHVPGSCKGSILDNLS